MSTSLKFARFLTSQRADFGSIIRKTSRECSHMDFVGIDRRNSFKLAGKDGIVMRHRVDKKDVSLTTDVDVQ